MDSKKKKLKSRKDKKIFRHTAVKSKNINLSPAVPRGGIRL